MKKKLILLIFSALVSQGIVSTAAATGCLNTYIDEHHDHYGDSSGITPRIMKEWENWCARGYTAQNLNGATAPCEDRKVREIRQEIGPEAAINFGVLQELRTTCQYELLEQVRQAKRATTPDRFDELAFIDDPDGYTNVRSQKNSKSQIVTRIVQGEQFFTYRQDGNWWQVRTHSGKVGYMHISRIRLID